MNGEGWVCTSGLWGPLKGSILTEGVGVVRGARFCPQAGLPLVCDGASLRIRAGG